jgi:cytochrome c-type biogenesis protein CcsB
MKSILTLLLVSLLSLSAQARSTDPLEYLPVQDQGRVKPFDTFARETLQLIWGKQTFEGRPAVEIVMTWLLVPQLWDQKEFITIDHKGLKEALNLPVTEKHFSPSEIFTNSRISLVFQELAAKREAKEKMDPYFQAVQRLENQIGTYDAIRTAQMPRVVPPKEGDTWLPVGSLTGELREKFVNLSRTFIAALPQDKKDANQPIVSPEELTKNGEALKKATEDFIAAARAENPTLYSHDSDLRLEVHYRHVQPFMIAWVLYLLAAIVISFAWYSASNKLYRGAWALSLGGFLLTIYGFAIRCYLTGRPPVSNMYETVVWVSFGAVLFSFILEAINKRYYILLAGTIVGTLCLLTADSAPVILDRSLQPLEPVLRSTLWLTIHVLMITISYAAFFLGWALGIIGLGMILKGEPINGERVRSATQATYRAVQIGVVLLAPGIILGGIWADYSWGRFWGWDPKETWALIALLGYIALLHARLTGWLQNFGMLAGSIVASCLVLMCWYGVNFVLGAGLHSYGFGAGGVEYVTAFVIAQLIFVAYVAYIKMARSKQVTSN